VPFAQAEPAKDVALRLARFSLTVKKMCEDLHIESGVGQIVRDHLLYYSMTALEEVREAASTKSAKRRLKLLGEAQKQLLKVLHWLDQLDNSGALAVKQAKLCRDSGGAIIFDLGNLISGRPLSAAELHPAELAERELAGI